ncbi:MAG: hypothetical protein HQ559_16410 [Lentisphaerae bacterium]|nr:hypothetical protein [Lentisphaerota bacterium]
MPKYIFVLGTGRTATVFLSRFFRRNVKRCLSLHEPCRDIKRHSNKFLSGVVTEPQMRKRLARYTARVRQQLHRADCDVLFQADPWLYGFTGMLWDSFDNPVVMHVVRHPFTYIPSHLNRMNKTALSGFLRDMIPSWKLRGDLTGDYSPSEWRGLADEVKMAWYWLRCNSFIDEQAEGRPNFKRLCFESLFVDDHSGLRDMLAFCDRSPSSGQLDLAGLPTNTAPSLYRAQEHWEPDVLENVVKICGPLASKYGYDLG